MAKNYCPHCGTMLVHGQCPVELCQLWEGPREVEYHSTCGLPTKRDGKGRLWCPSCLDML